MVTIMQNYLLIILILTGFAYPTMASIGTPDTPWVAGQSYTQWIEVFGRQVPLPNGEWVLAGVGTDNLPESMVRPYGVIATLVLFKLNGKEVEAFTLIHANAIAIDGGWGISKDCQRTDLPFAKIYENGEQHAFCSFIRSLITPPQPTAADLPAWRFAVNLAQQRGWKLPIRWREAAFRICDWHDVLDIRYAFATDKLVASIDSSKLTETVDTLLIHWVDNLVPSVYLGFKQALAELPVPGIPGDSEQTMQVAWNVQSGQKGLSTSMFSLWKVAINRIINMSTSIGITYLFVGNIYLATSLQLVSSTFHGGINYVEELLWNTYGPQRLREAGTYDFTYVGNEGN